MASHEWAILRAAVPFVVVLTLGALGVLEPRRGVLRSPPGVGSRSSSPGASSTVARRIWASRGPRRRHGAQPSDRRARGRPEDGSQPLMEVVRYASLEPFTTKDGSTIREYLHTSAPVARGGDAGSGTGHRAPLSRPERGDLPPARRRRLAGDRRRGTQRRRRRRDPDPTWSLAPHRGRGVRRPLPLLLRAALQRRGHLLRVS